MINSKQKGAGGEREFAKFLNEMGYSARRGQQFCGGPESPDVVCKDLPIHWEVKRVEKLNLDQAMEKCCQEAPKGLWRAVAHRKNRDFWKITLPAEDFFDLIKEWKELKNE